MNIGVLSDTHGFFDPAIPEFFAGVDHILHAGDIGPPDIIRRLERIAPVTAVLGNNDEGPEFRETELVELQSFRFLVHHIVTPGALSPPVQALMNEREPHVVVFGHTHHAFEKWIDGRLFFNPGYAGRQRFSLRRSIALLRLEEGKIQPKVKLLG